MRQSVFLTIIIIAALAVSLAIYQFLLPDDIRKGGPLVVGLMMISIMLVTFIIERAITLRKAQGQGGSARFSVDLLDHVRQRRIPEAIALCQKQQGTLAAIVRTGLERCRQVQSDATMSDERRSAEIQRAFEAAAALELPLLERNLIAMSTIASIATMIGLLGTVLGMIRSFAAMAHAGAPDAIQLATGISEALINTAGGLMAAIVGVVAYNFYVNKVDAFNYDIEETTHAVVEILTGRE
jgi:biopolymer transport protein ExbB